jgi:hypothetical protein
MELCRIDPCAAAIVFVDGFGVFAAVHSVRILLTRTFPMPPVA